MKIGDHVLLKLGYIEDNLLDEMLKLITFFITFTIASVSVSDSNLSSYGLSLVCRNFFNALKLVMLPVATNKSKNSYTPYFFSS